MESNGIYRKCIENLLKMIRKFVELSCDSGSCQATKSAQSLWVRKLNLNTIFHLFAIYFQYSINLYQIRWKCYLIFSCEFYWIRICSNNMKKVICVTKTYWINSYLSLFVVLTILISLRNYLNFLQIKEHLKG